MTIISSYTAYSDNYDRGANGDMRLLLLENPVPLIDLIHPVQTKEMTEIIDELNEVLAV